MIYANIIRESYESNLKELLNPMNIMQEYYENEISILKDTIKYNNESSMITESYELKILEEGFIENAKNKIKELIDKFIEWIKDVVTSIKRVFTGNSEIIKKQIKEAINKIKDATTMEELEKYSRHVGLITKSTTGKDDRILFVFNVRKYITEANNRLEKAQKSINESYKMINYLLNELNATGKLPNNHDTIHKVFEDTEDLIKSYTIPNREDYLGSTPPLSKKEDSTVNAFRDNLIKYGMDSIAAIDYIDKETKTILESFKTMESNAKSILKNVKEQYDSGTVSYMTILINKFIKTCKSITNLRIRTLNKAKNYYRVSVAHSTTNDIIKLRK